MSCNNPDFLNWLAVGDALKHLGIGLQKYAGSKVKELHAKITTDVGSPGIKCCCTKKTSKFHGLTSTACIWARQLMKYKSSIKANLAWHQSTCSNWHDPVNGYWEIAKLFMSNLGKNLPQCKDPTTTDVGPILNMFMFCNFFKIQLVLLEDVKDWRNKWAHAPGHTFTDSDKQAAFLAIESLLNDPELVNVQVIQDCHLEIKRVEGADVSILKGDALTIMQEMLRIQESREQEIKGKFEKVEKENMKKDNHLNVLGQLLVVALSFTLSAHWPKVPKLLWSFMAFLMFSQVGEKSVMLSHDIGCNATIRSPIDHFNFQEFDFSFHLASRREGFVGRRWFFSELEDIFEENRETAGVLITGEPGSGKSALISQLICSKNQSSLLIHPNIIGYHICEYSEEGKRDGARFVRNLVDQIAARFPDYSVLVNNSEQLRRELDRRCHKDPTGCFFATIVGPLLTLQQPDGLRYLVIDALDECFEMDKKTSEIMEILNSKILLFPKWLKVIITSRNLTLVSSKLPRVVSRTPLYATDERNVDDIRHYVSRFVSQHATFSDRLLRAMTFNSNAHSLKIFLDEVISRAEGNFLFVKTTLQYINIAKGKFDLRSLPTRLFDLYSAFFLRQFGENGFVPFRPLFEVLLAVGSPLYSEDIQEIVKSEYDVEDISRLIDQVSCFLRFGRDGTVRIYHQSFAEWLMNQTSVLSINKTRGHQTVAKFLFYRIQKRHSYVTFRELTELFMHILSGKSLEIQETALNHFKVTDLREPRTNKSILHHLATQPSMFLPVLEFFLQRSQMVDMLDASNKTPAFYAASEGFALNLQSFIDHGADVASFLKGHADLKPFTVAFQNTGIEEFSLIHLAAARGLTDVAEVLIKSNASVLNKRFPAPFHLAAANGHLDVIKLFYENGTTFDVITLHHAAAGNHVHVVEFLLSTVGLRDACFPCQLDYFSQLSLNAAYEEAHMYFCETALHAAVSRGLVNIVQILLAAGKESLECTHHSGKTVLMDAVERNDTEMADLLLKHGANVSSECGKKISKENSEKVCSMYSMFKQHEIHSLYTIYCLNKNCECGDRAIHVSAKHGLLVMTEKLVNGRIRDVLNVLNCQNRCALDVALVYDHTNLIENFNNTLINVGVYLKEDLFIKLAVRYCSIKVLVKLTLNSSIHYKEENVVKELRRSVQWSPCLAMKQSPSPCIEALKDGNLTEIQIMQKESERRIGIISLISRKPSLLYKTDHNGLSVLHHAALHGFDDAVKYLVELGTDTRLRDHNGNTALKLAISSAPVCQLNQGISFRCYTTSDGLFTSCNTSCHDEVARYLVWSHRTSISKCSRKSASMLKDCISKRMPLCLYELLKIGVNLNCRFNDFSSVMLLHLKNGGSEVSEVLKMFEVDLFVKCGVPFSESELHLMSYLSDDIGDFFKPSLNKKRFPLQRFIDRHPRGVRILDECYDKEGFLPIHRAAEDGNIAAIKWFKIIGVNTQLKAQSGLTFYSIFTFSVLKPNSPTALGSFVQPQLRYRHERIEELLRIFLDSSIAHKNYSEDFSTVSFSKSPILHDVILLGLDFLKFVCKKAFKILPKLRKKKFVLLDEKNANGHTPLHYAALLGFEDVVKFLTRFGADINIKNKLGASPLLVAIATSNKHYSDFHCYVTDDSLFTSCETTPHDEIGRFLIKLLKSRISKCDLESAQLLHLVISKQMPLSLYALLNVGVDVNCQRNQLMSPLSQHIKVGGKEISEVLKIYEVHISAHCGRPFEYSELHLISYISKQDDFGSFFKPSLNKKRSPLQRFIDRNPRGVRILDECYDEEGFLPIHRAAQGGNLDAVKWFKITGVNTQMKTRSGLTALDISILYLANVNFADLLASPTTYSTLPKDFWRAPETTSKYRIQVFEELLKAFFSANPDYRSEFPCGPTLEGLSPLHTAAVKGMNILRYVHQKMSETYPNLPINCVNKHKLDPVYLAQFYDSALSGGLIHTYSVVNDADDFFHYERETRKKNEDTIFKKVRNENVSPQYPDREVEYAVVFNYMYHSFPYDYAKDLFGEQLMFIEIPVNECPGYYDELSKLEEIVPLENNGFPDTSECSKIRVRHDYYWSLCMREKKEYYARTQKCPQILRELQTMWPKRRNRQITRFMAKRMGWSNVSQVSNIGKQLPFFFLHKMFLKEYEDFKYLEVLNEALYMSDIRFFSDPSFFRSNNP